MIPLPVPSFADLDDRIARKLVSRVDQGPISIYNYTEACTYDHAWDNVTRAARGLVLNRETGEIVARAFDKFFNLGDERNGGPLPKGAPDVVTVKHDGSLGILYRHEGRIRWTTRGSFYSPQAAVAERIWSERYAHLHIPSEFTVLTEIVGPETRNIMVYDHPDLVVLGIRNRFSGLDLDYDVVADWAGAWGMPVTERVGGTIADLAARAAVMTHHEEGFVARWGGYRVKIKSAEYLRVARIIAGLSARYIADIWYAKRLHLFDALPEEYKAHAYDAVTELQDAVRVDLAALAGVMAEHGHIPDRKAFVQAVGTAHPLFPLAMQVYSGRVSDVEKHVYLARFGGPPRPV